MRSSAAAADTKRPSRSDKPDGAQTAQSHLHATALDVGSSSVDAAGELPPLTAAATRMVEAAQTHEGFPVAMLDHWLRDASRLLAAATKEPPQNLDELRVTYERLGEATALSEAAMRSALDALDERNTAAGQPDSAGFQSVLQQAFESLRQCGVAFANLSSDFSALVHGPHSWPPRPVALSADRGDGRPLIGYDNTFKSPDALSPTQRAEAFDQRVEKFVRRGGDFADIIVAKPGIFDELPSGVHHDYVLLPDGTLRLFENAKDDDSGPPKPGHSLLATGSPDFQDAPVLLAGELWVLKDAAGDVEAVVIANNSGHYKPRFEDLENALPHLASLGIPAERVVLFGGPNNLDAVFREIHEKQPDAAQGRITKMDDILRRANASRAASPLALRLPAE